VSGQEKKYGRTAGRRLCFRIYQVFPADLKIFREAVNILLVFCFSPDDKALAAFQNANSCPVVKVRLGMILTIF